MKKKLIQFLLLFSLFFNIAHATVIAFEDDCHHESEYVLDSHIDDDCGDLCDMHHLFHFMAIINTAVIDFDTSAGYIQPTQITALYMQPMKETSIKPPIV